ncbi:MAG: aminopeptidase P family protein [Clostridiales bacterium]|nr:aminopeptidase P family protein [Clostridiales bacterium]
MNTNRFDRVVDLMREENLAQILVTSPTSVFYLTGTWVSPGERMLALLVRTDGNVTLFANKLFALQGKVDVPMIEYDDTDDCVALVAGHLLPGDIGIDKNWPSHFTIRLMNARADIRPVLGSGPVDRARMCKDEDECARMRASSLLNDRVIARLMDELHEGMTELEACARYSAIARELGASGDSFPPLICFGPNCAEPHHDSDDTPLRKGDSVICDVGLVLDDYCSDMTRTLFYGQPTLEMEKVYALVKAANEAGRAAVRPGVPMKEFDRAARSVIEEAGYGEYFIHRTGHSIGLEVHEKPDNSAVDETIAQPGMTFSVEPGIYLPGRFGVRIEDLVLVTQDGVETLNHVSRELRVFE